MTNYLPVFPLCLVVYPGESLNLHIFEPRYQQLVKECYAEAKPFGIPTVLNNEVAEMGCTVEITEIAEIYPDGKMDIRTRGLSVFRVLEIVQPVAGKLFSGAIVNYPGNNLLPQTAIMQKMLEAVRELHQLLQVKKDFKKPIDEMLSYDLAHHAGLTLEQEYELLCLLHELQRLEYLKRHLKKTLPIMSSMENLKEKIQQNGHFKDLKGFTFGR
ncbi:MAG: hypothetical protein RLZZ28_1724 [Bacteroidota bacterium]|jgi:Lon protease-like protein